MFWISYFRAEMVNLKVISCWMKTQGNLGFLSVTTVDNSVYCMHIGNSPEWLNVFYPMVVITDGSRILIAAKSLRRACEELAKFHGDIHCAFLVRTVEFDGDGDSLAIINEFDFYGMCYKAFAVRFRVCGLLRISKL